MEILYFYDISQFYLFYYYLLIYFTFLLQLDFFMYFVYNKYTKILHFILKVEIIYIIYYNKIILSSFI